MLSALKSRLFCGSSFTFFALKKSVSVPEAAGVIVTGGGTGTAGIEMPPGAAVAGATAGWPSICGAAALGAAATVCVAVAGVGSCGCGNTGSAEAVVPARPTTATTLAAAPPARSRQRRAISFIDGGPSKRSRVRHTQRQAPTVSWPDC